MSLFNRFLNLFRRPQVDREIEAELRAHIEMRAAENIARGMTPEDALRDARLRFGNPAATRERVTEADTALQFDILVRDVRFALRQLAHSPGFAITAILTLAVAICANAVVFSVLNALVLRPLNLPDAKNLYTIENRDEPMGSYPDYRDLRDRNRSFEGVGLYNFITAGLNTGGNAERVWVYEASGNYFDVLGVKPYLGRLFRSEDEHGPDSCPYLVLSYTFWQNRFHGDAGVVGRAVELNRHAFTILGVAPPGFRGTEMFFSPELWAPIVDQAELDGFNSLEDRDSRGLWMIARLKSDVSRAQAEGDMKAIAAELKKSYPKEDDGISFTLARPGLVGNLLGGPVRAFMTALAVLACLILLAACANLGSLFAARAADRTREIALRLALGSTRKRIVRQLLTEATLIALAGGAAGIAGSVVLLRALSAWQPLPSIPINVPVNPDLRTYLVAVALALASGLLCGLAPVRQILRTAPWEAVKIGARATSASRRISLRDVLLVVQIAACAVLMTSSLVAVRGLARSLHSSFGFVPQNAVLVDTDLTMGGYRDDRMAAMQRRMIAAAAALPGVHAVGIIDNIPLGIGWSDTAIYADNATDFRVSKAIVEPSQYNISPDYFEAAGTALLAGRNFTWHDDKNSPTAVIVNRTLAEKVFGSIQQAVGGHFRRDGKTRYEVVGVVEDGKYKTLTEDPRPVFFQPLLQAPSSQMWLVVRATGDAQQVAPLLRAAMRNLDPGVPFTITPWPEQLDGALFAARVATVALGVLGMLGAVLAITGIFGMASYSVGKRLKEMGVRIALGASRGQVLGAAVGRAFRLLAVGSVAGMVLGLAATRVLSFIVYQATPRDPVVLCGTVLMMLLVGLLAAWAPAQRAMGVDPARLLREE